MKILTWNMQGGHGKDVEKTILLHTTLVSGKYDVICLQEATEPLGSFELMKDYELMNNKDGIPLYRMPQKRDQRSSNNEIYKYTAVYYKWGYTNKRCSLITYVKDDNSMDSCGAYFYKDTKDGTTRPMLWVIHNNIFIGNIHLKSGKPNEAFEQFLYFKNKIVNEPNYCIIGDYNIDALENDLEDVKFHHVKEATHIHGACLDYMYASGVEPEEFKRIAPPELPELYSDHYPVEYII